MTAFPKPDDWAYMVEVAQRYSGKPNYPTVTMATKTVVAMDAYVKALEASNEFLRQRNGELLVGTR